MIRPPPPHSGNSTKKSPSFKVKGQPSRESWADASLISSQVIQEVSIKAIAKPSSSVSAWPMFRIASGSATSNQLVCPRSRRTRTIMEAAAPASSAALKYSPSRKSHEMKRYKPTKISRETTGRCSLCCDHSHRRLTGSCPVIMGTSVKSSM